MTGVIDFSIDATSNGTGAPPINFAEGQPAGTVNNSARGLMAAIACWRDDLSGLLIANGGAANALTLSTRQGVTAASLKNGLSVAFRVDAANTAPATLNLDGTGAKALRRASYLELAPGDLARNTVHRVVYLEGPDLYLLVSPSIEAPGRIAAFGSVAAIPPGWLRCEEPPRRAALLLSVFGDPIFSFPFPRRSRKIRHLDPFSTGFSDAKCGQRTAIFAGSGAVSTKRGRGAPRPRRQGVTSTTHRVHIRPAARLSCCKTTGISV